MESVSRIWSDALYHFTGSMDTQMFRNRHKRAWTEESVADLLPRFLAKAEDIETQMLPEMSPKETVRTIEMLADSANYCMMMADLLEKRLAEQTYGKYLGPHNPNPEV